MCHQTLKFLGHIISPREYGPELAKASAIREYPAPTNVKELQAFVGFMCFYHNFIPSFSDVAMLLLRCDSGWTWSNDQAHSFMALKAQLNNGAPALPLESTIHHGDRCKWCGYWRCFTRDVRQGATTNLHQENLYQCRKKTHCRR